MRETPFRAYSCAEGASLPFAGRQPGRLSVLEPVRHLIAAASLLIATQLSAEPWPWIDDASEPGELSILLMGDTNLQGRERPAEAYDQVRETLLAADLRFLNLECALAGSSADPRVKDIPHKHWVHSEPDQVEALTSIQVDAVGVANNVNYPWQALLKSLSVLDEAGIPYTGGGQNIKEAHSPVVIDTEGTRIGFLQFATTVFPFDHAATQERPGIAEVKVLTAYQHPGIYDKPGQPPIVVTWPDRSSLARMKQSIASLAGDVDFVVASYHWGISNSTDVVSYQSELGRAAIDSGADLVLGHGPHTYQRIELHRQRPILHSVGQFVFDDRLRLGKHQEGLLVRVLLRERELARVSLVPSWRADDNLVHLYSPRSEKGRELLGYLKAVNRPDGAALKVVQDEILILGVGTDAH